MLQTMVSDRALTPFATLMCSIANSQLRQKRILQRLGLVAPDADLFLE